MTAVPNIAVERGPAMSPHCADCPFAKDGQPHVPVRGIGPRDPEGIVVGEGPGRNEVVSGLPFVGASGRMLDRALAAVKVDRKRLWVTNATLCIPPPGSGDAVKKQARECCAPRLDHELRQLPKAPILALGGVASQSFLGDKFSITKLAGSVHDVDVDGRGERAIIPTVHPAAILRGGDGAGGGAHAVDLLFWNLLYDVAKFKRIAGGDNVRFSDDIAIEYEDPAKAHELVLMFAGHARQERMFAIDAESVGTDGHLAIEPMYASLTAIGLATPKLAISVAYPILRPQTRRVVAALMGDSTITKVMHNRLYDCPVFERHGMPARGHVDCTLLMHHSAFPGLAHDLQRVTTQFFCVSPWKAEFRAGKGDVEELLSYNARDSLATARLREPLRNCLKGANAEATYDIDIKMAVIAQRMATVGIPISREVNTTLQVRFHKVLDESMAKVRALVYEPTTWAKFLDRLAAERAKRQRKADPPDYLTRHAKRLDDLKKEIAKGKFEFSIGNADHIAAYLKARGVALYHQTAKGKTSTKREVLEGIAHVPEVAAIVDFREAAKMNSTFVAKLPHYMDANGRIHPIWSVNKITGRWGAEHPQVMNWPKADKKKNRPNLREQVVVPKGRKLVGADFAQLEARIIALLSGDTFLVGIFHNKQDIHSEFARIVWPTFDGLPIDERVKLRDMIKRPEYGALYGAAVQTMYEAVVKDYPDIKLADLARMNDLMKSKMTGVEAWHQQLLRDVIKTREIRSAIYGRRRCFPLGNAEESTVFNFPVQATGADIMDTGLVRLAAALPDADPTAEIILQVHDAAYIECDENRAEVVRDCVTTSLAQTHTHNGVTIEFPADAKIGDSWDKVS